MEGQRADFRAIGEGIDQPLSFRGKTSSRPALYFSLVFCGLLLAMTLAMLTMKPFWVGVIPVVIAGIGVWGAMIYIAVKGLASASTDVILDKNGLRVQRHSEQRTIPWTSITRISRGSSSMGSLLVEVRNEKPVSIWTLYVEDGKELARILSQRSDNCPTPSSSPRALSGGASHAPAADDRSLLRIYGPKKFGWLGPVGGALMSTVFVIGSVVMALHPTSLVSVGVGAFGVVFFGFLLVGSLGWLQTSFTSYTIDAHSIEGKSPLGSTSLDWSQINTAVRTGEQVSTYRLSDGIRTLKVESSTLARGPELMALIDQRLSAIRDRTSNDIAGKAFGMDLASKIFTLVLLGICGPALIGVAVYMYQGNLVRPHHPEDLLTYRIYGVLSFFAGILLLGLLPGFLRQRYIPHAHSLEVRGARGTRTLEYDKLRRVELGTRYYARTNTTTSTLTLVHPDGSVRIDSNVKDFGALQDYILSHVDPSIVRGSNLARG